VSADAFAAAGADAKRHGRPSVLAVGQAVSIRRGPHAGKLGAVRDVQGFKVLVRFDDGGAALVSRISLDVLQSVSV